MKTVVEPFDEFNAAEPAVRVTGALPRRGAAEADGLRERSAASLLGDDYPVAARPRPGA
ncbi:hypothetical protein OV203_47720 [Nannocystis sp. ILAH1]|uniref:hypothetical protein n=1 Tax=Nannocystis sp. ILAH1 TaxID=2996789 RepID=UPI00226E139D|nr:hypothetical protein [Nannocystis sp. ILAH1]MCY0994909.1 hypothetical protein [Nannocystis sp. ILAH1]